MKLAVWAVLLALIAGQGTAQEITLVVENGRVVVGDGSVLEPGFVAMAGDRIVAVSGEPIAAADAERIDASGKTVLPGLIDAHVHLSIEDISRQPRKASDLEDYLTNRLPDRLREFLRTGITTVASTGDYWPFILEVRGRIRSGDVAGPRLLTSGPVVTAVEGHPVVTLCGFLDSGGPNPWCRENAAREVATVEEAGDVVSELAGAGVDFVKFVVNESEFPALDGNLVTALIEAIHAEGLLAYAHVSGVDQAIAAVEAGLDRLVHVPVIHSMKTADADRLLAAMRKHEARVSTTLVVLADWVEDLRDEGQEEMAAGLARDLEAQTWAVAAIAAADSDTLALGTDSPHLAPAEAYHRELELLSGAGIDTAAVLRTATLGAAEFLGRGDDLGSLEPGKLADLIVVDGNPLESLDSLANVVLVVQGGVVVALD